MASFPASLDLDCLQSSTVSPMEAGNSVVECEVLVRKFNRPRAVCNLGELGKEQEDDELLSEYLKNGGERAVRGRRNSFVDHATGVAANYCRSA